VCSMHDCLGL